MKQKSDKLSSGSENIKHNKLQETYSTELCEQ